MAVSVPRYAGTLRDSKTISGIYRARVENNMDPMRIGRVQIRVPMIHGLPNSGISSNGLPWAYPCMMSAGYGYGTFIIPEVGEYVFVIFEDNDSSKPVYIGSCFGSGSSRPKTYGSRDGQGEWVGKAEVNEVPVDAQRVEPTRKVIYHSPKGASIEVDEQNGSESISITDAVGQVLKFESNLIDGVEHKRFSGDMENFEPVGRDVSHGSRILLMDSGKQYLEMKSSGDVSSMTLKCGGFSIESLSEGERSSVIIKNSNGGTYIKLGSDGSVRLFGAGHVYIDGPESVNVTASSINLEGDVTIVGS